MQSNSQLMNKAYYTVEQTIGIQQILNKKCAFYSLTANLNKKSALYSLTANPNTMGLDEIKKNMFKSPTAKYFNE